MAIRCLLVDDHSGFLAAASALLESQGITVVGTAMTVDDGLRAVSELRPDVVLADVYLGDSETGFDLERRLQDTAETEGPVVILTSTYAREDIDELAQGGDVVAFLPKSDISAEAIMRILDSDNR